MPNATESELSQEFDRRLRAATRDAQEMAAARLDPGDLLCIEVQIKRKNGTRASATYGLRPTPEGLMAYCGTLCDEGDRVTIEQTCVDGSMTSSDIWPFSLETAADMVADLRGRMSENAPGNDQEGHLRELKSGARVAHYVTTGPPLWSLPKVKLERRRTQSGRMHLSIMVGWRYTCHSLHYIAPPQDQQ